MKRTLLLGSLVILPLAVAARQEPRDRWLTDLNEATELAKTSERPLLVAFR